MRLILAIDPGPEQSGWVRYLDGAILGAGVADNADVLAMVKRDAVADVLAIEMIASYGMPVGATVFDTCVWIGRYSQAWRNPGQAMLIFRRTVKLHLCGTVQAKDGNVKQALLDIIGPQGKKKAPGPTYGVSTHAWAALGVAVTAESILKTHVMVPPRDERGDQDSRVANGVCDG